MVKLTALLMKRCVLIQCKLNINYNRRTCTSLGFLSGDWQEYSVAGGCPLRDVTSGLQLGSVVPGMDYCWLIPLPNSMLDPCLVFCRFG